MTLTQLGYTTEHAGEIEHILTMVSVTEIKIYGSYGEAEGDLSAVWCYPNGENKDEKRIVLVTECGVVCFINIANRDDEYLYDADAGGFVKSYTYVYFPEIDVSSEAQTILQMMAEDVARDLVNYPLTVEFDLWKWQYSRRDREYIVQGGFTCTNALGVTSEHTIKLVCEASEDYARISVTTIYLDGKNVAPKN